MPETPRTKRVMMSSEDQEKTAVKIFNKTMLAKLRENAHKPHWEKERLDDLLECLQDEVEELTSILDDNRYTMEQVHDVMRECADVANFAMMIHDNVRKEDY